MVNRIWGQRRKETHYFLLERRNAIVGVSEIRERMEQHGTKWMTPKKTALYSTDTCKEWDRKDGENVH